MKNKTKKLIAKSGLSPFDQRGIDKFLERHTYLRIEKAKLRRTVQGITETLNLRTAFGLNKK